MDQLDSCRRLRYDLPVFTQVFKIISEIEENIEVHVTVRAIIIGVAVGNTPGAGIRNAAIGRGYCAITIKRECIACEMICFIFSAINK